MKHSIKMWKIAHFDSVFLLGFCLGSPRARFAEKCALQELLSSSPGTLEQKKEADFCCTVAIHEHTR